MASSIEQFDQYLRLTPRDFHIIRHHRVDLVERTRGFADYFKACLGEQPAQTSLLAHYHRDAAGLHTLLAQVEQHFARLLEIDVAAEQPPRYPFTRDMRSSWIISAYRCYFDYLKTLLRDALHLSSDERPLLDEALFRLLMNDLRSSLKQHTESASRQPQEIMPGELAGLARSLWSVEISSGQLLYASPAIAGRLLDRALPIPGLEDTLPADRAALEHTWQEALAGRAGEVISRSADHGEPRWMRRQFYPRCAADGTIERIDGTLEDITALRKPAAAPVSIHADALTGLPNRAHWQAHLSRALTVAEGRDQPLVVMVTDLNHFKAINYTIGHSIGDDVLKQIATRLHEALPEVDMLARLGGDEFGILLETPAQPIELAAQAVAQRINRCLAQPIMHEGHEFYLSGSTGIALYPEHGADANTLLSRADIAMYRAKRNDAGYLIYHPETDGPTADRLQLSHRLREAIKRNELELDFQPKVDVRGKKLCGVEALIRWRNPVYGLVQPDGFIPMAEQMGFITPITEWVIAQAFDQYAHWAERGLHLPVAINVSVQSLNANLVETIRAQLARKRIPASALQIEITENALLDDGHQAEATIAALHALGISIAIDDFGTGYSSLHRLKNLPIATLKIDKSFVQSLAANDQDAVIVRSIIDLGHNLGFDIVAEGVEQQEALNVLDALDCDAVQGFYISRPLNARQLGNWIINSEWRIQRTH